MNMHRRDWIKAGTLGSMAALLPSPPAPAASAPPRVIDTHTHFYDPSRLQGVPWPSKGTPLYRTVLPADWKALAAPLGIHETVIVEASPWVEDNQWILDLAEKEKSIVGFCGNLDPNDKAFAAHLKRFAANPIFRGIRWRSDLVRLEVNPDQVLVGARLLAENGLQLDLNGPAATLPHIAKLAAAVPDLRIVIDHLGGSGDPQKLNPGWREAIVEVAAHKNVFMKVSALVEQVKSEPGKAPQDASYYTPVLDHLWETFGEDRLIYGSNWPVSDKGAPYEGVFRIVREYFAAKGQTASEKYFWRNSQAAYRWIERA